MYKFKVDEEVARWTLEVHLQVDRSAAAHWWVAFSNPTAGPWKRLMAKTGEGEVEVYRYRREEERPDLIIVSDILKAVLIVEAKDNHDKLLKERQMVKSIRVMREMEAQLVNLGDNPAWDVRAQYSYIPGFLWGEARDIEAESRAVANAYYEVAQVSLSNPLIGFAIRNIDDTLIPQVHVHGTLSISKSTFLESLNFPLIS